MLFSAALFLFASIDEASIDNTQACARFTLIGDCDWNRHEIEALLILQLQYRRDGCGGFGRHGEAGALQQSRSA